MGVVVVDSRDRRNGMLEALQHWMEQDGQRKAREDQQRMQQEQFQQTYGLDKQRTDAHVQDIERKRNFEEMTYRAGQFYETTYKPLVAAGRVAEAEQAKSTYSKLNPYVIDFQRDVTDLDATNANLARWQRDTTGRVASGGQGAIDVNLATKLATNEQLNPAAFGHQEQLEQGPKAVQDYVAIKGDRRPGATAQLQAGTQLQMNAEDNATTVQIAGMSRPSTVTSATGTAPGGNYSPAIAAAGDDVLRGGDITRIPAHSRMQVFEYIAARGGKALPKDVANTLRSQVGAEVALDKISAAFEAYAAAKTPADLAKSGVNLRSTINGSVPLLARGVGHTGVLTQQDVDSVVMSILGADGVTGLAMTKAMPGETRSRISGMKGQFAEIQNRLLQDLVPGGPAPAPASSGAGSILDESTAAGILREAGGDPNKAREIARRRGYSF
jgi:hypothetical protein